MKALDCDPFSRDSKIFKDKIFKDGDKLGKAYFPNTKLVDFIGDKIKSVVEISSNYRQLNKNIRRIKEKFEVRNDKDVNIGVVVINYGTSREEFFSYLLNNEYGLINVQDFGNIDNLVLFSMCSGTTLMMDEVYENEHIFSVCLKSDEFKRNIYNSLRLNDYIVEDGKVEKRFEEFKNEEFTLYKYIIRNGFYTIQPYDIEDSIIDSEFGKLRDTYDGLEEITQKSK